MVAGIAPQEMLSICRCLRQFLEIEFWENFPKIVS
jgi:hypothetical protein